MIILNGRHMEYGYMLIDYRIQKDSTLHMVLLFHGGTQINETNSSSKASKLSPYRGIVKVKF
jgi:hypothetical protein